MIRDINTYYKEKVKEHISNIFNGKNDDEIIKLILDSENETQIKQEYIEIVKKEIDLYRIKIDTFFSDARIEIALTNNDGNLILAKHKLAKELSESLHLPYQIKESAERYAEKVLNAYWTKNQRIKNIDNDGR